MSNADKRDVEAHSPRAEGDSCESIYGSKRQLEDAGGIILCGGKSTRMGTPKEWLDFGSEKMLQRLTRILQGDSRPCDRRSGGGTETTAPSAHGSRCD